MDIISLFSGIGAFEKALQRMGEPCRIVNFCEIDKYAAKAYSIIHNVPENLNLRDIRSVNAEELTKNVDLITFGFPCQDISCAGKQKGFTDENGNATRSGLFFEALRIIQTVKPKYAIAENVKALTSKKFEKEFFIVLTALKAAGYNVYHQVLNAKDYGIPQNRERVFIICIRKDIDDGNFRFPEKQPLTKRLKDILETDVDEKYYLRDEQIQSIKTSEFNQKRTIIQNDICGTLLARDYKDPKCVAEPKCIRLGGIYDTPTNKRQAGGVYDQDGLCTTITTPTGGNNQPLIIEPNICNHPLSKKREFNGFNTDVSPCLIATDYKAPKCTMTPDFRIRKLTPKECWRLMGFDDSDIDNCVSAGLSNTQLYKMAGNSIVVNVLEYIFKSLKKAE